MKRFFVLLFFTFLFTISYSQDEGNVQVIQDDRIDTLLNKHIELNEQDPQIEGWRINIFYLV